MTDCQLYHVISSGAFWTLPDDEVLILIRDTFPGELDRLKQAYSITPNSSANVQPVTPSISHRLYGHNFDEINRSLLSILALRWIWNDDYKTFVGESSGPNRLKRSTFNWLWDLFTAGLKTPEDILTLVTLLVINDLGKDPNLAEDHARLMGIQALKVNHDMMLQHAVEADLVPALQLIPAEILGDVKLGIELGSQLNFGQLAQAENAPGSLAGLSKLKNHKKAFEIRFMEQILDLAGAAGHGDWTCARMMTEPIVQSYRNVYVVATNVMKGVWDLRTGYDIILWRKRVLLHQVGFIKDFDINVAEERAMLRVFCMGDVNDVLTATIYDNALNKKLGIEARAKLIHALNVDGSVEEPAVQPTYAPAMFTKALSNTRPGILSADNAVTAIMEYLSRVMTLTDEDHRKLPNRVTVVERDIRGIESVVCSEDFRFRPSEALKNCEVPEAQVANTA